MDILKLLYPLEELETRLSELYKHFSDLFKDDTEASIFFGQMSVDEAAHADLVRFQRRIVRADPTHFKDVDADSERIEELSASVGLIMKSAESLTVEKALAVSIDIENSVAEQHYITSITLSNPEVSKLFSSLTSFDCRHFMAVEEFARKRGFSYEMKKSGYIESCRLKDLSQEKKRDTVETMKPPQAIPQEFLDRIDYLYTWHKSVSYYKLLEVTDYATEPEIKESYHRLAKEFHPDRHADLPDYLRDKLSVIFSGINLAYSTLIDPGKRKEYDWTLGSRGRLK